MANFETTIVFKFENKSLHIGTKKMADDKVDSAVLKQVKDGINILYIPPKVIKGTIKRMAYKILDILFPNDKNTQIILQTDPHYLRVTPNLINHPYISLFGAPGHRGKLKFHEVQIPQNELPVKQNVRLKTGIRIDRRFMSTIKGALFTYEIAEVSQCSFKITSEFPLTDREQALLVAALKNCKYASIGGKGTTGIGIISDVLIVNEDLFNDGFDYLKNNIRGV